MNVLSKRITAMLCVTLMALGLLFNVTTTNNQFKAAETEWNFGYTGNIQEFTAPYSGKYKLEVWGAQGGSSAVNGALGGYSYVEVPLLKDETIYLCVGGAGQTVGDGGYNGGGASIEGASGGGATSITTTNKGVLANFASSKNEVIVVAGGGAGSFKSVLPDQECWIEGSGPDYHMEIKHYTTDAFSYPGAGGGTIGIGSSAHTTDILGKDNNHCEVLKSMPKGGTDSTGYAFGQGESGNSGAGGGWYGGYAGKQHYMSSGGGSGYLIESEFFSNSLPEANSGDGKAKITYEGVITRTITINTGGAGTYDGQEGNVKIQCLMGDTITLSDIDCKEGYTFIGYRNSDKEPVEKTFVVKDNMLLDAYFSAPLIINKENTSADTIRIYMQQDDPINKYYKVLQSTDGKTYYDALMSLDIKNGTPTKNRQYAPGVYTYTVPFSGEYKFRLYGAQGGNIPCGRKGTARGGNGAYTEGVITLKRGSVI